MKWTERKYLHQVATWGITGHPVISKGTRRHALEILSTIFNLTVLPSDMDRPVMKSNERYERVCLEYPRDGRACLVLSGASLFWQQTIHTLTHFSHACRASFDKLKSALDDKMGSQGRIVAPHRNTTEQAITGTWRSAGHVCHMLSLSHSSLNLELPVSVHVT